MSHRREIEHRVLGTHPPELRAEGGEAPELRGYASLFGQWTTIQDWWGDAWLESVAPGAYAKTIGEADIRALFNHNPNVVLGRNRAGTLDLSEDGTGLYVVVRPPDNEWGRPVLEAVRRGDVSGQSIAFRAIKEKWERPEKKGDLARRTILEAALSDVSVVTYPAFPQTSVQARDMQGVSGDADPCAGHDDTALVGRAMRLVRLAAHGYDLDADDRATVQEARDILERVSREPAASHSSVAADGEPGRSAAHSAEARARRLAILKMRLEQ